MSGFVIAQSSQLKEDDKLHEELAYIDAISIYMGLVNQGVEDPDLFMKLGDFNYFNAQYNDAVMWYKKLFSIEKSPLNIYYFRYGQALKSIGRVEKAGYYFDVFYKHKKEDSVSKTPFMISIQNTSGRHLIEKLNINSNYPSYPAFFGNGELYVVSSNKSSKKSSWSGKYATDIFRGMELKPIDKPVKTKYNEGSIAITKDGQTLYFTRNDYMDGVLGRDSEDITRLKLFRAKKGKYGKWKNIESLDFCSSEYSTGHPALSPNEQKLYFASDRPGGKGGVDIYVCERYADQTYSAPVNMSEFNTIGDDMFPFVDADGVIYFSSDGHSGLGGLDVFYAKPDGNGGFGDVQNMGKPINSPFDDFAYVSNTQKGYFASNRDNQNDDIFSFALLDTLADPCRTIFKGVLTNKKTNLPIPNATLVFLNSKQEEVGRVEADEDGYYSYRDDVCGNIKAIRFLHDDYFADEVFVSGNEGGVVQTEIALDLRKLAIEEETTSTKTDLAMLLNPIYFDLNKSFIREDAKIELEKIIGILNQHPLIKIDVRAHTDSRGLDSFNLALSNRRAKSTIKYMIDRGIDPDRITGRGYGESELINNCSDGVVCQDYLHEQNRRSEFIIVKK